MQILDSKFAIMEVRGKSLINAGVLKQSDIDAGIKGNKAEGRVLLVGLSAYSHVIDLIHSAKSNSPGLILGRLIIANPFSVEISSFTLFVNMMCS